MEEGGYTPDAVDRILQGPKRYINLFIVAVNILVFFLVEITGDSESSEHMLRFGASYLPLVRQGEVYRLFTCMFLHFGLYHLGNNMVILLFLGDTLEQLTGHIRYAVICLGGGLIGSVVSCLHACTTAEYYVSAGASGCVFAVTGGLLYIVLRERGHIGTLNARKMVIMAALSVYNGFVSTGVDNYAHVGGLLGGFILCMLLYRSHPNTEWEVQG